MLFNSWEFAIFLMVVFGLFWSVKEKHQWVVLLTASYLFYLSWNVMYSVLLISITLITFFCGIILERYMCTLRGRKAIIWLGIGLLCGILCFYKYFHFFSTTFINIFGKIINIEQPILLNIIFPVGISFYTFTALGYVIDVYRGQTKAEKHLGKYALFVSFFPQMTSGPIERSSHLFPQLNRYQSFCYKKVTYGLKLMAWGFFKKMVIADGLAIYVDKVYSEVEIRPGFALVLAMLFYTLQIYCDFSGYSDIAVGVAKLFGIELLINFKSPYFSTSMKEFWGRWHISLSTWFRDYVYIPLGGNRKGRIRADRNLLITFLLSGLWHGANWTYIIWGGIHGTLQVIEKKLCFGEKKVRISRWMSMLTVFVAVNIAWIFFRADNINQAFYIISHLTTGIEDPIQYIVNGFAGIGIVKDNVFTLARVLFCVVLLFLYDLISLTKDVIEMISQKSVLVRWTIYCVMILMILFNIPVEHSQKFVYFQF